MPHQNAASEGRYGLIEKTSETDNERIRGVTPLPPPEHLIRFFPIRGTAIETLVADTRQRIRRIMAGQDDRLLVVVGPCSIHDPAAALDYAHKLKEQRARHADTLEVVGEVDRDGSWTWFQDQLAALRRAGTIPTDAAAPETSPPPTSPPLRRRAFPSPSPAPPAPAPPPPGAPGTHPISAQ